MKMHWAYVAGFLDGEGSIFIRRTKGKLNGFFGLTFCQSGSEGLAVLTEMKEFFESQGYPMPKMANPSPPRLDSRQGIHAKREIYQLVTIRRDSVKGILQHCLPYMRVKKQLAEDTIRYLIMFPSLRAFTGNIRKNVQQYQVARGSDHYLAKLNEERVGDIKRLLSFGKLTQTVVARHYGVSLSSVHQIRVGKSWKHVTI